MTTTQAASPVELEGFRLVKKANEALDRIDAMADDWLIIGEAYQLGRRLAPERPRQFNLYRHRPRAPPLSKPCRPFGNYAISNRRKS